MKKLALILVSILAFGALLNAGEIVITKSFVQSGVAKPELLFATIRINSSAKLRNIGELTQKDRASITTALNAVIQDAKRSEICKGGSYSINPIISYKDDKRNTIGQNVEFALDCKFKEANLADYNALLKTINAKISKNALLSLPQPEIESRITQIEINAKKEALFAEFLRVSEQITDNYSKILGKTCEVRKITSQDSSSIQTPRFAMAKGVALNATAEMDSTHTKAPISDEVEVELRINLELGCK